MVQSTSILTANVRVSNSSDTDKKYDIVADVNVNNGTSYSGQETGSQITSGTVMLDDVQKASFSKYGSSLNINYPDSTEEEQTEILAAVNAFVSEVKEYINSATISISNEQE